MEQRSKTYMVISSRIHGNDLKRKSTAKSASSVEPFETRALQGKQPRCTRPCLRQEVGRQSRGRERMANEEDGQARGKEEGGDGGDVGYGGGGKERRRFCEEVEVC